MRVLHVISSISPLMGGQPVAMDSEIRSVMPLGVECEVASTDDGLEGQPGAIPGLPFEKNGVIYRCFKRQTRFYWFSFPLFRWLLANVHRYDLVHVHGVFNFPSNAGAYAAMLRGVPYIVQPHGMLLRFRLRTYKPVQKKLSLALIEGIHLRRAAALLCTAEQELRESRAVCPRVPGHVIPLPLDINQFAELPSRAEAEAKWPALKGARVVLFMSRLHHLKRLELLMEAMVSVRRTFPDAMLLVAGDGDASYVEGLRRYASSLGLDHAVVWAGFLGSAEKKLAFAVADVFALPSYSENFAVVVAEAMACGVPCVVTPGVAISNEIRSAAAGIVVEPEVGVLANAITRLLIDRDYARRMGANARRLVSQNFSPESVGRKLLAVYSEACSGMQQVSTSS